MSRPKSPAFNPVSLPRRRQTGTILVITMNVIIVLSALAAALLLVAFSENREHVAAQSRLKAFYIAEAGLSDAIAGITGSGTGNLGGPSAPIDFNGGGYWVTSEENAEGNLRVVSTGIFEDQTRGIETIIDPDGGSGEGYYTSPLIGQVALEVDGNAYTDSYDSGDGNWLSQATTEFVPGRYRAGSDGGVESNGDVFVAPSARVFGDAVGDTLTIPDSTVVSGATIAQLDARTLPSVTVPATGPSAPLSIPAGLIPLGPGVHAFTQLQIQGTGRLLITGPATLVVDDLSVRQAGRIMVNASAGPVYFYINSSLTVSDGARVGSSVLRPKDLLFFSALDNHTGHESSSGGDPAHPLLLSGSSQVHGVIYAPNGSVGIIENARLFGSVVGSKVVLIDGAAVHYDESLGLIPGMPVGGGGTAQPWTAGPGGYGTVQVNIVTWRQVAPESGGD